MSSVLKNGVADLYPWLALVKSVVATLKNKGDIKTGAVFDKYINQLAQIAADASAAIKDGFQVNDLRVFGEVVPEIMKIAKDINGFSGEEKRQFVADASYAVYRAVDGGIDGSQNRIKVPFVGFLSKFGISSPEEKFEKFVVYFGTEAIISAVYGYMKEKNLV
jgi:hypothetical protein